jgi:hypothetical protein
MILRSSLKEEGFMNYAELDMPLGGRNAKTVDSESASNGGFLKKAQNIFLMMLEGYSRNFDQIGPEGWSLMQ